MEYLRDPAAIYDRSFALIREETDFSSLPRDLEPVAVRLVHACGMTDLVADLRYDTRVVAAVRAALNSGATVLADCEMAASAIIRRLLPEDVDVVCTLNDARVPDLALEAATTRSAAAVSLWADRQEGAVVVIGNAPTALFALLEALDAGAPKPTAILAFPVGFVGAAESKAELAANPRGVPFLTLAGRRGGSAMAGAALNAIAKGLAP
jgi:precorrin-8X/cobalt-precorrin-8 methylmutase